MAKHFIKLGPIFLFQRKIMTINKTGQKALIIKSENNKWTGKICIVGPYIGRFEAGDSFVHQRLKLKVRETSHIFEVNEMSGVDIPDRGFFLFNDTSMMPLPDLHEDESNEEKLSEPETI
jgi:hypothetical protein